LKRASRRRIFALAGVVAATLAHAVPIPRGELAELCVNAEDQAQCGRRVEARQLTRLARIVERDGDELRVSLAPFGLTVFRDTVSVNGAKSYAVWDYVDDLDMLVLFTTDGDRSGFLLVQRRGGNETRVPSEPVLAPDQRHFVTADFCATGCDNDVAVWRIDPHGVRKESTWAPQAPWSDVSVTWKGADTVVLEYSATTDPQSRTIERRLGDPSWKIAQPK
jgi:hypothetical protein